MNEINKNKDYWHNLIIDYLTGNVSEASRILLNDWITESQENQKYFNDLTELWHSIDTIYKGKQFDSDIAYAQFKKRISLEKTVSSKKEISMKRIVFFAAVLIPMLFLNCFAYDYFVNQTQESKDPVLSEIIVPNGSKTRVKLSDGTTVWLNSGSTIQCDADFGKKNREVKLSGEAYLEVAYQTDCPFIVSVGEINVKVLGTRFNVNAYSENSEIAVALLQGSIEMNSKNEVPILLAPKDVAYYDMASKQTKVHHNVESNTIGWINNKLLFEGESFEQIVYTLERNFNVKINIHNTPVKARRFVGDFVNNETIEQIFNVMSSDGKFKYKIKGNVIDVY